MNIIEAIILGIIQGATEFLPISSSGHLVLLPVIFKMTPPDLTMVGLVHLGSLLAVLVYFRRDLWEIVTAVLAGLRERKPMNSTQSRLGWYIVVGCIPAAVTGLLLEDFFDSMFSQPVWVGFFLLVTAGLLVLGEKLLSGEKSFGTMTWTDTLVIGLFQTLALFPGLSRSGSTIVGGLLRGLDRSLAARYSFYWCAGHFRGGLAFPGGYCHDAAVDNQPGGLCRRLYFGGAGGLFVYLFFAELGAYSQSLYFCRLLRPFGQWLFALFIFGS
ncbi:MAG: undecaprenyl-diphosphate phosphatase [Chloroflexi bacterium]|nr:undecaprenyl-diphosphate phosphatase [Chloroflexota bacterium]